jgi:hypothetical protein
MIPSGRAFQASLATTSTTVRLTRAQRDVNGKQQAQRWAILMTARRWKRSPHLPSLDRDVRFHRGLAAGCVLLILRLLFAALRD